MYDIIPKNWDKINELERLIENTCETNKINIEKANEEVALRLEEAENEIKKLKIDCERLRNINTELTNKMTKEIKNKSMDNTNSIVLNELKQNIDTLSEEPPPRQKEVYKLSREEYLKHFEIAQLLSISEKTVERHITEALRFLKKGIEQY